MPWPILGLALGNGSEIQIDVGLAGASLQDLADLVNNDSQNQGRVSASVIESEGRFRLSIETTETGAAAELTVLVDSQVAPLGGTPSDPPQSGNYALIDAALAAEQGTDETIEIVTTEETLTTYSTEAVFEDVQRSVLREDDQFEVLVTEFAQASNRFREVVNRLTEPRDTFFAGGVLANDSEALRFGEGFDGLLGPVARGAGAPRSALTEGLAAIGLGLDDAGLFSVDGEQLESALADRTNETLQTLVGESSGLVARIEEVLLAEGRASRAGARLDFGSVLNQSDSAERGRLDFFDRIAEIGSQKRS